MNKILSLVLVAVVFASVAIAATVTNRLGQVTTVSRMSEGMAASTVITDQSVLATRIGEQGVLVAKYAVPAGTTGAVTISTTVLPKGAILLENGVIECTTAITGSTNYSLAIGGVSVLAGYAGLVSTGIKAAVPSAGMTTNAASLVMTFVDTTPASNGVFTVHLPYLLGTAQ